MKTQGTRESKAPLAKPRGQDSCLAPPDLLSEKERRRAYIALYSQERVTWASERASRHKSRAKAVGRTEHFSAWQWLDLCATNSFECHYCRQPEPLEVHHRHPLSKGGANTIDNIVPLCETCHIFWHENPHEISKVWLAHQEKLLFSFQVGDYVKRNGSSCADECCRVRLPVHPIGRRQVGVIAQLFPHQRPSEALPAWRGRISHRIFWDGEPKYYVDHGRSSFKHVDVAWERGGAKALVHWLRVVKGAEVVESELLIDLRGLEKVEKPLVKKKQAP